MANEQWRVAVVGGGPGGAAAAIELARLGLTVVTLEASHGPQRKVGECLPPSANPLLAKLGLAESLDAVPHLRSHSNRSIWGATRPVDRDFVFGLHGSGWHLDREAFEYSLCAAARSVGVDWRYGAKVVQCERNDGLWRLAVKGLHSIESIEASFVIDATGRSSRVAKTCGSRRLRYDSLVGVSATIDGIADSSADGAHTLVESVPTGWWYSARQPNQGLSVAFMTDNDLVKDARFVSGWLSELAKTQHTGRRAGNGRTAVSLKLVPAETSRLTKLFREGWLAVGDAAVAYDPLSSYGITAALGTGIHAAQAIALALTGKPSAIADWGDRIDRMFTNCLLALHEHYAVEARWPNEPFWKRRQLPRQNVALK